MTRLKTIRRFDEWKTDPENMDTFFRHIEGSLTEKPKRFRDACVAVKAPYTLMYVHIHGDAALKARYESCLAAKADSMMHESLDIADSVREEDSGPRVMAAKLAVETRHALAGKWDRDRYGDRPDSPQGGINIIVNRFLSDTKPLEIEVKGQTLAISDGS